MWTQKVQMPGIHTWNAMLIAIINAVTSKSDEENIPELVLNISGSHILYLPMLTPSDEEADKEVAQICKTPVYYHIRSLHRC